MSEKLGLGNGVPFSEGVRAVSSGALGTGTYWGDGNVSLAPVTGNYTATSLLTDGNFANGETASGATITVVHSLSSPISATSWNATLFYKGAPSVNYYYWDGAAWQPMTDTNGVAWAIQLTYAAISHNATFSSVPASRYFRMTLQESDTSEGNAKVAESQIS